jgi:hypothetical protein
MSKVKYAAAGLVLGCCMFFAAASMLSMSSGARVFVYQGF